MLSNYYYKGASVVPDGLETIEGFGYFVSVHHPPPPVSAVDQRACYCYKYSLVVGWF